MANNSRKPLRAVVAAVLTGAAAFGAGGAVPVPVQAQAEPGVTAQPTPEQPAGAFEVVTRHRILMDSAAQAERAVTRLEAVAGLEAELDDAARRQAELQALLTALTEGDHVRPERLSRVRDQALLEDQRLDGMRARTLDRLEQLGEMRGRWLERQRYWRAWQVSLRGDPGYPQVAPDMAESNARIDSVLERIAGAASTVVALQRRIEDLRAEAERIGGVASALRAGRRAALLQRHEPVLFSTAHRAELGSVEWRAWSPWDVVRTRAYVAFVRDHAGLAAFHLLLALGLALLARRLRSAALPEGGWSGLLQHPWALGVHITVAVAMQRIVLAPPLWDGFVWALFGATAAVLAGRLFATRALRLTVYLLAIIYPAFLLLEALQLPGPVLRVVLAFVAACALPVFAFHARRRTRAAAAAESRDPRRIWPLRIGAGLWALVLGTVVPGYDMLGRWVLHATMTSAAVVFLLVVLVAMARGAIATLLRVETKGRARFLRRVGVPLAHRIMLLLQVVLIAAGVLVLLDVWELAPSPLATWQRLVGAGFAVGDVRITVGRILMGLLVVYFAVVLSWLLRTMVHSEVYRRWDFDRGVGDSINRLVHYALITIGFIAALAVLGVQLQNFAIIAGALGIGIGFGLQNVVNNFVSGLILLFERPVRVGDTVVLDGEWGTIRKIGLRSTIMLTFDQSEMIVPNADLVSEKVTNWTLSNPVARVIMTVGVAYGSNIAAVLEILRAAGPAHESVLSEPPPQALFIGFGDSSLDFELRVWVREIRQRLEVRSTVLADIERRLAEAGIEIPFPQRDLHLRSVAGPAARALLGGSGAPAPGDG
jgi:potassium-dependent mechanosensitive channel